jgi:hypothetical protein
MPYTEANVGSKLELWVDLLPKMNKAFKLINLDVVKVLRLGVYIYPFFTVLEFLDDLQKVVKAVDLFKENLIVGGILVKVVLGKYIKNKVIQVDGFEHLLLG